MCGRYTLATPDLGGLRGRFPLHESLEVRRRFNVAPGDDVLAVIRRGEDGAEAEGAYLRWGLVPFWARIRARSPPRRSTPAPRRSPSGRPIATPSSAAAA